MGYRDDRAALKAQIADLEQKLKRKEAALAKREQAAAVDSATSARALSTSLALHQRVAHLEVELRKKQAKLQRPRTGAQRVYFEWPGEHVVQLEARPADPKGRGAVSIRDLFRAALRIRADRMIVGEIRGGEALDIVQAMTSGHGGCMSTLHASHPRDTLTRLETMAMMSDVEMPLSAMRTQIGSGVQLIVQVSRLQDGSRKVTHITEVVGFDWPRQRYELQDIFVRDYAGVDEHGRVISELVPTGTLPAFLPQLQRHDVKLPDSVLKRVKRSHASAGRPV